MDATEGDLPQEVEVKLLLDDLDVDALRTLPGHREVGIRQTYVLADEPGETRVRERTEGGSTSYVVTNKRDVDGGLRRVEVEREVSAEEAARMLSRPDPSRSPVEKVRHLVPDGVHTVEVDVYPDGSSVAEVELSEEFAADADIVAGRVPRTEALPPWFPATVVADVTEMREFKNASLAKGFPEGGLVSFYRELSGRTFPPAEARMPPDEVVLRASRHDGELERVPGCV